MWEEKDICWMAGLFEGEGTVSIVDSKRNGQPYARVALGMTDLDVIEKLYKISGIGGVEHRKIRPNRTKRMYYWRLNKREEIKLFLSSIKPYMGERRSLRIQEALDLIKEQQTPKTCLWCKELFSPQSKNNQKYCTVKCCKTANRPYNKAKEESRCPAPERVHALSGTLI